LIHIVLDFFSLSVTIISDDTFRVNRKRKEFFERVIKMNEALSEKELIQAAQREYKRKWREKNPDKVREHNRRYWLKKAEELQRVQADDADQHGPSRTDGEVR
jgi:hypothetical protein